jgi:hypothetical protein
MSAFYVVGSDHIYHNSLAIFILYFIKLNIHKVDSLFLAKIGVFRQPSRSPNLNPAGIHP